MAVPAALTVINTTELLEQILLNLSTIDPGDYRGIFDLARSRRVCHSFRATIDGSQDLQRNIFIQAEPATHWIDYKEYGYPGVRVPHLVKSYQPTGLQKPLPVVNLHPALDNRFLGDKYIGRPCIMIELDANRILKWQQGPQQWEEMFVTQPPVQAFNLYFRGPWSTPAEEEARVVAKDEAGVRLGHVRAGLQMLLGLAAGTETPSEASDTCVVMMSIPAAVCAKSMDVAEARDRLLHPDD